MNWVLVDSTTMGQLGLSLVGTPGRVQQLILESITVALPDSVKLGLTLVKPTETGEVTMRQEAFKKAGKLQHLRPEKEGADNPGGDSERAK